MQDYDKHAELGSWVQKQRAARLDGTLTEEKLQILYAIGFEFGDVAQITQEWENKFDQLLEWLAGQVGSLQSGLNILINCCNLRSGHCKGHLWSLVKRH